MLLNGAPIGSDNNVNYFDGCAGLATARRGQSLGQDCCDFRRVFTRLLICIKVTAGFPV